MVLHDDLLKPLLKPQGCQIFVMHQIKDEGYVPYLQQGCRVATANLQPQMRRAISSHSQPPMTGTMGTADLWEMGAVAAGTVSP